MVVEVAVADGVVDVLSFDGDLTVRTTSSDGVILGPVRGSLSIDSSSGPVIGRHLRASELTVEAQDGAVDLMFARAPMALVVTGDDESIRVLVPDLLYRLEIATSSAEVEIDVDRAAGAPRDITISSTGPVTVARSP